MVNGIWQEFLKIIQQEVGSQMVETWLKAVTLQRWDSREKMVYLAVPNAFVKDWLATNYVSLFEHHLKRLLNVSSLKIVFSQGASDSADATSDTSSSSTVHEPQVSSTKEILFAPAQLLSSSKTQLAKKSEGKNLCHINSNYTFSSFVVGPSNQLAYAAAQAVTERPGKIYNPLFVYGGSGLGKTHLLHAIGNEIRSKNKSASVLYQTADRFVNEFINAIRFDKIHQFQTKYKDIDVLLVDDIQFISNKEQTQEAFFHIFNTLYDSHKQIIFSSDTYPRNIDGIAERLRSRLEWGLVTDIQVPTLETKIAILKKKAVYHSIALSDDVAHFLASRVHASIRALEGSLIQLVAVASLTHQIITLDLAKKVLIRPAQESLGGGIDFEKITKHVCEYYSFTVHDLRSSSRAKEISLARQVAMYLMKKMTNKSFQEIGFFFGRRDHSTVMHAVDKIQTTSKSNPDFSARLVNLEEKILG